MVKPPGGSWASQQAREQFGKRATKPGEELRNVSKELSPAPAKRVESGITQEMLKSAEAEIEVLIAALGKKNPEKYGEEWAANVRFDIARKLGAVRDATDEVSRDIVRFWANKELMMIKSHLTTLTQLATDIEADTKKPPPVPEMQKSWPATPVEQALSDIRQKLANNPEGPHIPLPKEFAAAESELQALRANLPPRKETVGPKELETARVDISALLEKADRIIKS